MFTKYIVDTVFAVRETRHGCKVDLLDRRVPRLDLRV